MNDIHELTGDAVGELEWKLNRAQKALDNWEYILTIANRKQTHKWRNVYIQQRLRVKHLTSLLTEARALICPICGNIISADHEHVFAGDRRAETGDWDCESGETIIPF